MAKISSEQRLRNANLSLSDENFGPNMGKLNREKDTKANLAKAKAAEARNRDRSRYVTEGKNINNTRIASYEDASPKKKAPAPAEYKMPKSTTPDMDTTQGTTGSRVSFDAGEIKETPKSAPIEEKSWTSMNESEPENSSSSRFSSSNPLGMKKGGKVSSASKRADGCAIRGKTRA